MNEILLWKVSEAICTVEEGAERVGDREEELAGLSCGDRETLSQHRSRERSSGRWGGVHPWCRGGRVELGNGGEGVRLPGRRRVHSGGLMFIMMTLVNKQHYILESCQESKSYMCSPQKKNLQLCEVMDVFTNFIAVTITLCIHV